MDPKVQAAIDAAKEKQKTLAAAPKPVAKKILSPEELVESFTSIPDLMEADIDETEHIIIYGDPGTGKTCLAGLLSEFYNILWFDGDKGLKALKNNLHPEMLRRIRPIRIPDSTMYPTMVSTMLKVVTGRQVKICMEHGEADCIICERNPEAKQVTVALNNMPANWIAVMDSQTQFVESAKAKIYYKLNPSKAGKEDVDDFWRGTGDEVFAYWGALKNITDKFGNYVKDLKCAFITISHNTLVEMEDKRKTLVPVAGSDKSSGTYAKYFGTEILAKINNNKHSFISSSTYQSGVQTKSRANVALEKEETPSLIHVLRPKDAKELLKGSYNEWFFADPKKRSPTPPTPKGVLEP